MNWVSINYPPSYCLEATLPIPSHSSSTLLRTTREVILYRCLDLRVYTKTCVSLGHTASHLTAQSSCPRAALSDFSLFVSLPISLTYIILLHSLWLAITNYNAHVYLLWPRQSWIETITAMQLPKLKHSEAAGQRWSCLCACARGMAIHSRWCTHS